MPALSVILVTHDSEGWLPGFFASVAAANFGDVVVVLADSGSNDGTVVKARALWPAVRIAECGNVGFGAAANRGIAAANGGGAWVLLCNPDVTFGAPFGAFLRGVVHGEIGDKRIIAPRLVNPDGTVQASVGDFPTVWGIVRDQFRAREFRKYRMPQPVASGFVDWASAPCLLMHRETFLSVGGFDEKYFLYVEEVDLQRRLAAAGWRTWFEVGDTGGEIQVVHHHPNAARTPRPEVQRWAARGTLRYFAKFSGAGLCGYRLLGLLSGRLRLAEAMASRKRILENATGP